MFTGLIEEVGQIDRMESIPGGKRLRIACPGIGDDLQVNDSLAVNGVCLTVTRKEGSAVWVDAVGETLQKTTLAHCQTGTAVNLELALRLSDRLGGHIVQGHVNGMGVITSLQNRGENFYLEVTVPRELEKYLVAEGSVAVEGISLTIARKEDGLIGISVIPHTWKHTTLNRAYTGQKVNIEVDILAKYVENMIKADHPGKQFTEQWFKDLGYGNEKRGY